MPIDDIFVDSRAASMEVVRRLIALGHQRIAMVAGIGGPWGVRVEGYREALAAHHLEPLVVIEHSFTETAGHQAANAILDSGFAPTAIFAANDLMAIGAMQALRNRKIAVPDQIAVVGF
ncbi:substrate-binding domain-containing protein [Devosia sp. A8/3-2]|nr:substrate-binding domain-containing protein [Devosia sp. A8/3-2]